MRRRLIFPLPCLCPRNLSESSRTHVTDDVYRQRKSTRDDMAGGETKLHIKCFGYLRDI